ncbi:hypothetical protein L7F22_061792 [Adiantum nelumboides]|nr:hypothetical protein [Adiantum nelumboides]
MDKDDWIELDELARSTIMLTLYKSIYFNLKDTKGTYGVWQALSNLYEKKSVASQVFWLKKLIDLSKKETTPMSTHLTITNSAPENGLKCIDVESSLLMEKLNYKNVDDSRCTSVKRDPEGHSIAWAAFGEGVLENCKMQPGGLQKKISNWRSVYGPANIQGSVVDLVADKGGSNKKEKRPVLEQKTSQSSLPIAVQTPWLYQLEVELEILQSQVDHAKVHLAFIENMLMHLKEGQSLCLAPKPYQAPTVEEYAIDLEGQCTGCGEPLATPHVAAMYMLACKHKYHPLCFASLLASGHACNSHCCSEPIPESVLAVLGGARSTTDYESRKFCSESLFAGQRLPTSEGLDRTTGSTIVTKAVEVMCEKNSAEEMEKALMELAAEDGVNVVQKMMEQEVNKEGEQEVSQEVSKEGEQEVSKEGGGQARKEGGEQVSKKGGEQEVSKEKADPIPESEVSPDVTLNQLKKEQKKKRATAAATDQEVPKALVIIQTVEEIEIDRVPPVYKNPSKYDDVEDPSKPAVLIDLQGVLIYSHFIGGKEAPPDLDANEHIQVEEPPYCYFVRKDAEQFLVMACYFANVFIWSSTRLRNVERRVQRLFPSAPEWLSGLIGHELCDVANFNLSMGKPVFFKTLCNFWCKFPCYNEGNTLLIDDSRYKCATNRPDTYLVVPKERKKDCLINDLGVWLLKWKISVDRLAFAKGREQPPPDQIDQIVWQKMKENGGAISYSAWQKRSA